MVQNEHLTTANCDEVTEALLQDAAAYQKGQNEI